MLSGSPAQATLAVSSLSLGVHTIMASYQGDGSIASNFASSNNDNQVPTRAYTLTITYPTTTAVASSSNPSAYGQSVTFTATVTAGAGTFDNGGTVQFVVDGSNYGAAVSLSGGSATIADATLSSGTHSDNGQLQRRHELQRQQRHAERWPDGQRTTLLVTSFTPTATGFVATFNGSLEVVSGSGSTATPVLHLYDDATGSLGAADVTVVGSSTGPVVGSLVVDTPAGGLANSRVTFIQTGQTGVGRNPNMGVLADDTYTVTLLSGSTGFQDTSGNQLDGNAVRPARIT